MEIKSLLDALQVTGLRCVFVTDPAHGWIAVPLWVLIALGIDERISSLPLPDAQLFAGALAGGLGVAV